MKTYDSYSSTWGTVKGQIGFLSLRLFTFWKTHTRDWVSYRIREALENTNYHYSIFKQGEANE